MTRSILILLGLASAACARQPDAATTPDVVIEPSPTAPLPYWEESLATPLRDAIQVWERGKDYYRPPEDHNPMVQWDSAAQRVPFRGLDRTTFEFLEWTRLLDAVQFSDAGWHSPEERHAEALSHSDPLVRLQALVVLLRVSAPRSVDAQWNTLKALTNELVDPEAQELLLALNRDFEAPNLEQILDEWETAPNSEDDHRAQWAMRAVGVAGRSEFLPRIAGYALREDHDVALAAERTLHDFEVPEANAALLECVKAWHYDMFLRAARELQERDPVLLEKGLLEMGEPKDRKAYYGILLGRLGNTSAVPHLCRDVKAMARIDREMFDMIEQLALPEHRLLIEGLPEHVRDEQRERAESVLTSVLQRWSDDSR